MQPFGTLKISGKCPPLTNLLILDLLISFCLILSSDSLSSISLYIGVFSFNILSYNSLYFGWLCKNASSFVIKFSSKTNLKNSSKDILSFLFLSNNLCNKISKDAIFDFINRNFLE